MRPLLLGVMAAASLLGCASDEPTATSVAPAGAVVISRLEQVSPLTDCDIPFEQLSSKAPSCQEPEASKLRASGRRCESYGHGQFPEVLSVKVYYSRYTGYAQQCSGTLIAPTWVLIAAHCLMGSTTPTSKVVTRGSDLLINSLKSSDIVVQAINLDGAPASDSQRAVKNAYVHNGYTANQSDPRYQNDLALLELDQPYNSDLVPPATLSRIGDFNDRSTIAGYGYSNVDNGQSLGNFNLTWPAPLQEVTVGGQLQFVPGNAANEDQGTFCQGDSGGPVFAGRYRGCPSNAIAGEPRPRLLEGVISFDYIPSATQPTDPSDIVKSCVASRKMEMQDITTAAHHQWICARTASAPRGCD